MRLRNQDGLVPVPRCGSQMADLALPGLLVRDRDAESARAGLFVHHGHLHGFGDFPFDRLRHLPVDGSLHFAPLGVILRPRSRSRADRPAADVGVAAAGSQDDPRWWPNAQAVLVPNRHIAATARKDATFFIRFSLQEANTMTAVRSLAGCFD